MRAPSRDTSSPRQSPQSGGKAKRGGGGGGENEEDVGGATGGGGGEEGGDGRGGGSASGAVDELDDGELWRGEGVSNAAGGGRSGERHAPATTSSSSDRDSLNWSRIGKLEYEYEHEHEYGRWRVRLVEARDGQRLAELACWSV